LCFQNPQKYEFCGHVASCAFSPIEADMSSEAMASRMLDKIHACRSPGLQTELRTGHAQNGSDVREPAKLSRQLTLKAFE
jgi:hypothetical protein